MQARVSARIGVKRDEQVRVSFPGDPHTGFQRHELVAGTGQHDLVAALELQAALQSLGGRQGDVLFLKAAAERAGVLSAMPGVDDDHFPGMYGLDVDDLLDDHGGRRRELDRRG